MNQSTEGTKFYRSNDPISATNKWHKGEKERDGAVIN